MKMNKLISLLAISFFSVSVFTSAPKKVHAQTEIESKGDRITWVDASVQLPYNYASIIGFEVNFTLLTDRTNYTDGYGGVTEDENDPYYNMHFPCYMVVASRGASDNTVFNKDTFGLPDGGYFEQYMDSDLAKKEICKFGVGEGYYVAGYLANGIACQEGENMVAGDSITVRYQGTSALFEQGDPMMTFYGYTADFQINSITWITGTPVITVEEDWDPVEHEMIADVETVENPADQNGSNYVNIIKPKGATGKLPVVLWIHGGGWTTTDRTSIILNTTMEYFLAKGYAFVSAEYTLSDRDAELTEEEQAEVDAAETQEEKDTLTSLCKMKNASQGKQMIYDLKLAVRFIRANADKYGLDTRFIGAMGESAGAHLALLMGTTNGSSDHEGPNGTKYGGWDSYSSDVQAMASYSTPVDLTADSASYLQDYLDEYPLLKEESLSEDMICYSNFLMAYSIMGYTYMSKHLVSGTLGTKDAVYDDELTANLKFMSPYWQVNSDTPPMYLVHGAKDGAVLISNAYAMELQAKTYMDEANVKTAYYADATHVEKKYFDAYAQYSSTFDFFNSIYENLTAEPTPVEPDPTSETTSGDSSSDSETTTKKGCGGSLIGATSLVFSLALAGTAIVLKRKKENQ